MIVSHKHKYIFVHVPKVAGSSIAAFLARNLGAQDIMADTWGDALDNGASYNLRFLKDIYTTRQGMRKLLSLTKGEILGTRESKFSIHYEVHQTLWRARLGGEYAHTCISDVKEVFPQEFKRYYKFAFVRNPYAHAVSLWRWRTVGEMKLEMTFSEFLGCLEDPSLPNAMKVRRQNQWEPTGFEVFSIDGKIAVDFVGRLESLNEDMKKVCNQIGLEFDPESFPHAKNVTQAINSYRSYYRSGDKAVVERLYSKYFDHFDYSY